MQNKTNPVSEYLTELPEERKEAISRMRELLKSNLNPEFEETMTYGMISYVVPHSVYPQGYHVDPKQPLPFISLASQKNFIALYHMGIYADPELLEWFKEQYAEQVPTKLDMGKSCIRFKNTKRIPYDLIGELAGKMSAERWISLYEDSVKR